MDAEFADLLDGGVAALGGLLATDAYEHVRPRLLGLLRRGRKGGSVPTIEHFDRVREELADAVADGDARRQRALSRELRGYVRDLIDVGPLAVADLLASAAEEVEPGGRAAVSLVNNTIIGPVQGSGVQINSF
ncbi:hypothetical protein ACIPJE_09995 [Streptomyces albidoflavus]